MTGLEPTAHDLAQPASVTRSAGVSDRSSGAPRVAAAEPDYDVIVVGGGPCGATTADDLARRGLRVMLLDRAGRIKPCGGAIPPRLVRDFDIPDDLLVARITSARIISPSDKTVDMPIDGGYVGMVDRDVFDEWLRERAAGSGADRRTGTFSRIERRDAVGSASADHGYPRVVFATRDDQNQSCEQSATARLVIGADGARSKVGRQEVAGADNVTCVFAYHEIVKRPDNGDAHYDPTRCDVYYQGKLSPDFYAWVFPHGGCASIGVGSANKGFSLRGAVADLRRSARLTAATTIRHEGAPIPLKPLKKWDNGRDVLLAGDAAGVVAPASGEGIYYAMLAGRLAADAAAECLFTGDVRALKQARRVFMKQHGRVFFALGLLQRFWYSSDKRRERFVSMCADPDVQRLTWQSYMNKELVRRDPMAHVRVFMMDVAHLAGMISPWRAGRGDAAKATPGEHGTV